MRSLLVTAEAVARAALMREESRGAHTRIDYEGERDEWVKYNIVMPQAARTARWRSRRSKRGAPTPYLVAIANAKIEDLESGKVGARRAATERTQPKIRAQMTISKFRVWRGNAEGGEFKEFEVEVDPGMVVLDVLHRIQAQQANDLAVRWNCKAGKCGSCSMEINGKPRLACMTRMNAYGPRRDDHRVSRSRRFR